MVLVIMNSILAWTIKVQDKIGLKNISNKSSISGIFCDGLSLLLI